MARVGSGGGASASKQISDQIAQLKDWRGKMLAQLRTIVLAVDHGITEEFKWGTAVWAKDGLVCSAGAFKDHVKLNFFKGASLKDPKKLFNAGLDAKTSRSIDFQQGDKINAAGLKDLIGAAIAQNASKGKKK
jgi:hypothetical protein